MACRPGRVALVASFWAVVAALWAATALLVVSVTFCSALFNAMAWVTVSFLRPASTASRSARRCLAAAAWASAVAAWRVAVSAALVDAVVEAMVIPNCLRSLALPL